MYSVLIVLYPLSVRVSDQAYIWLNIFGFIPVVVPVQMMDGVQKNGTDTYHTYRQVEKINTLCKLLDFF